MILPLRNVLYITQHYLSVYNPLLPCALCPAVVIIQINPPLTRTISEGESTDICVSKNIGSIRAVNFTLTSLDGSAGGMLKCVGLLQCVYVCACIYSYSYVCMHVCVPIIQLRMVVISMYTVTIMNGIYRSLLTHPP